MSAPRQRREREHGSVCAAAAAAAAAPRRAEPRRAALRRTQSTKHNTTNKHKQTKHQKHQKHSTTAHLADGRDLHVARRLRHAQQRVARRLDVVAQHAARLVDRAGELVDGVRLFVLRGAFWRGCLLRVGVLRVWKKGGAGRASSMIAASGLPVGRCSKRRHEAPSVAHLWFVGARARRANSKGAPALRGTSCRRLFGVLVCRCCV